MKVIGRIMLVVVIGLLAGCDLKVYQTSEGVGVIGPNGGYFRCDNEMFCNGTPE